MKVLDFIETKGKSKKHSEEEIVFFIENLSKFTQEEITQWLKAVKANGLDDEETSALTMAMAKSGTVIDWTGLEPTIDKHSTGGIGDKVTLLFAPLVAAYETKRINVPKLSGRALGITGGTIDKLESIPGLRTNLTIEEIKDQVKKIGLAIAGAGTDLAPADKKLYAIRDVTDTIDSIPLIASSIMSKKIAGGSKNIILDVKFGSGAFMKDLDNAKLLAKKMVAIGKKLNKNIKAVISDMNQPLGFAIGNLLEIKEVYEFLNGKIVSDLKEILFFLACEAIKLVSNDSDENIKNELENLLASKKALKKFKEMVTLQGGKLDADFLEGTKPGHMEIVNSSQDGYIHKIDAHIVGTTVHGLGAGRKSVSDTIDYSVGIFLYKKVGDFVKRDENILEIHSKNKEDAMAAKNKLSSAIEFGDKKPLELKLIHEVIR